VDRQAGAQRNEALFADKAATVSEKAADEEAADQSRAP
jgi:hypothetical protein